MSINNELCIIAKGFPDEKDKLITAFRKENKDDFTPFEIDNLIDQVTEMSDGKLENDIGLSSFFDQMNCFRNHLYSMQTVINSIVPIVKSDRIRFVLSLFDVLHPKYGLTIDNMTDRFHYVDISDIKLLSILNNKQQNKELFIGIDTSFITALNKCSEWELHTVSYDSDIPSNVSIGEEKSVVKLSALGLFKRIVSYGNKRLIRFYFKDNDPTHSVSYEALKDMRDGVLKIHFNENIQQELNVLPYLIQNYVKHQIESNPMLQSLLIQFDYRTNVKKASDRLVEAEFYSKCFESISELQQVNTENKPLILFQGKVSEDNDAIYMHDKVWKDYHRQPTYNHARRTVIEYMQEACSNKAILFTV